MKKNSGFLMYPLIIMGMFLMLTNSCKKKEDNDKPSPTIPVLTTSTGSDITQSTASCGGNITSDGGATVTARGVCWSTSENPTIADSITTDGTDTGSFTSSITGLISLTTYYVRAYATNSVGTAYGNQISFTTLAGMPILTTSAISVLSMTTATIGGNITSDGGATVLSRGVCWGSNQNPTIADSKTTDGTGVGIFTSNLTGLTANTTYHVRAYATNSSGTSYGNDIIFKTYTGTVTDIDGNVYNTITIGTQVWMAENLKTTKYRDGTAIPNSTLNNSWENEFEGAYCDYNNTPSNSAIYGRLYNYYAATDGKKISPTGWHIPTDAEFTTLITYLGGESVAGGKLKEAGKTHWLIQNVGATNESGFTFLPGGSRIYNGIFEELGSFGYLWSSSFDGTFTAGLARRMSNDGSNVYKTSYLFVTGFSIRCVKD